MSRSALDAFLEAHPGHDLDLGGLRYHYLDEGGGEPVVMLHGNPSWSFSYRRLVDALAPTCRTIVPDHIGCGLSDKPGDAHYDYTLERRVRDLEALLDHLGIESGVTLVLHDWGGMIGMTYASRHPERISRLVLLNTAAFHLPPSKPFPWPLWACRTPLGAWLVRGLNAFCRARRGSAARTTRCPATSATPTSPLTTRGRTGSPFTGSSRTSRSAPEIAPTTPSPRSSKAWTASPTSRC